jgi:cytochrome c peroxidase
MGWRGPQGGIHALIRKMGATAYYRDLFAWAFDNSTITEPRIQQALGQFVRAMISSSSRWDTGYARVFSPDAPDRALTIDLPNFTAEENRGRQLFMSDVGQGGAGCSACHLPPTFALAANSRSNGLDRGETRLFKAPSLRNVGLTGPYMHDGRFATLAEVIDFYDRDIQEGPALDNRLRQGRRLQRLNLTAADRAALVAFLKTLNDPVLTTDARFSDPFRR